ncbi:MAG TPA: aromatic-ring-hydroxylating dioxygenase subunit beta [Candidatus Binatia bacterium]|nr:aromatic-ring-hydroxylating dioxygenase subunit beta [Candidatus Binatia bacterium]
MELVAPDLHARICAFYDEYGFVCDDEIERWPDLFTDDATYKIVSRENHERELPLPTMSCDGRGMLRDRVTSMLRTSVYVPRQIRHLIANVRITGREDERVGTIANFAVFESFEDTGSRILAVGRYYDLIATSGPELRFKEKVCVYDGNLVPGSIIYPL